MTSLSTLRAELVDLKAQLVTCCASKLKAGDWHAVQDAASDIREIDAKIAVLAELAAQPPSVLFSVDAGATITVPLKVEAGASAAERQMNEYVGDLPPAISGTTPNGIRMRVLKEYNVPAIVKPFCFDTDEEDRDVEPGYGHAV